MSYTALGHAGVGFGVAEYGPCTSDSQCDGQLFCCIGKCVTSDKPACSKTTADCDTGEMFVREKGCITNPAYEPPPSGGGGGGGWAPATSPSSPSKAQAGGVSLGTGLFIGIAALAVVGGIAISSKG
jgi:hypothetical protein